MSAVEVDPLKLASPPYEAVIVCEPAVSDEVLSVAVPALTLPVPMAVLPSRKLTVPVGEGELPDGGVTVAVMVTDWPTDEGLGEEATAVVVAAFVVAFTTCVTADEVDPLKLESPP